MNPKISVIVPVYNVENFIKKSMESLFYQTFEDFEALIVDDGSQDDSIKMAKEVVGDDKRFIFFAKENAGLGEARNYGLDRAKGEYLSFLDSDDYFDTTFLEKMYNKIQLEDADMCNCNFMMVHENGTNIKVIGNPYCETKLGSEVFASLYSDDFIVSSCTKMYKRKVFNGFRFPKDVLYEDLAILHKIVLNSQNICFIDEPLLFYVQRKGSTMNGFSQKRIDDRFIVVNKIKKDLIEAQLFSKYEDEFIVCYFKAVVLSIAISLARYSDDYMFDVNKVLNKFDKQYFTFKSIFLYGKKNRKEMCMLFLFKLSPRMFKYSSLFYKILEKNYILRSQEK